MKDVQQNRKWAQQTYEMLRDQLPTHGIPPNDVEEYFNHWRDNEKYVFEFHKKHRRQARGHGDALNGMIRAENKAVDVLNHFYTGLIRDYLKSLK